MTKVDMDIFPKELAVDINGLRLSYRDWGGAGQEIILLHGLASNCRIWDLVAPNLAINNRVVALDQRGHGKSDKPNNGYDFETIVGDLQYFINVLQFVNPIVIGHSWGGNVALSYASEKNMETAGIVLVDGGTIEISSQLDSNLEQAKIDMAPPVWDGMTENDLLERARRWRPEGMDSEAHIDILLANFQFLENGTITSRLARENHIRIIEALWEHKPSSLYKSVRCPVLIMPARQGWNSETSDKSDKKLATVKFASEMINNSKVVWLEDSIHDVPIQRPDLVTNVILDNISNDFLC